MKKRFTIMLLLLVSTLCLFACSPASEDVADQVDGEEISAEEEEDLSEIAISERKLLRVGTPGQHYPWNFYEAGELKGIDIETLEEACDRIGYDVEYEIIAFEGLYGSIDAGSTDTGA